MHLTSRWSASPTEDQIHADTRRRRPTPPRKTSTSRFWQQYLRKVPNGYRCHANTNTGVEFPTLT